jgi:hypothetical protein
MTDPFSTSPSPGFLYQTQKRVCKVCARSLPLDDFHCLTDDAGKTHRYRTCKKCSHVQQYAAKKAGKRRVVLPAQKPETHKVCTLCKQEKPFEDFYVAYHYKGKPQRNGRCKPCQNQEMHRLQRGRERVKFSVAWFGRRFQQLGMGAKKRHIPFALSRAEFEAIYRQDACTYCGARGVVMSIDRKDNDGPYIADNCVLACCRCNFIKSNKLTCAEMLIMGKALGEIDAQRRAEGREVLKPFHVMRNRQQ